MTLPPPDHPQYELRRRIADCRERLRRTRAGQRNAEHAAHTQAHDEAAGRPTRTRGCGDGAMAAADGGRTAQNKSRTEAKRAA